MAGVTRALSSVLGPACVDGLGDGAEPDPLRAASRRLEIRIAVPFKAAAAAGELVDAGACGAGDSAELPRPPTCMVIFLDDVGVSVPCPTLSLILAGCAGSGTAAWACLSWA